MECERALEAVSAALDGELTRPEQAELEKHLSACPSCRALAEELRAVAVALERAEEAPPPELSRRVMAAVAAERKAAPVRAGLGTGRRRWAAVAAVLAVCVCLGGVKVWSEGGRETAGAAPALTGEPQEPAGYLYEADESNGAGGEDAAVRSADGSADQKTAVSASPEELPGDSRSPEAYDMEPMSCDDLGGMTGEPADRGCGGETSESEPVLCTFWNEQAVRVSRGAAAAPAARILGSVQSLEEFAAQFPEDDLSGVLEPYDEDYFRSLRLLAVVVESGGSATHGIPDGGLRRDEVVVVRTVPETGSDDMAAWIIFAEVGSAFEDGEELRVVQEDAVF